MGNTDKPGEHVENIITRENVNHSKKDIEEITQYSIRKENIEINLNKQEILYGNKKVEFSIDAFKKECLLNGLDDIAMTLDQSKKISSFENEVLTNKPWLNKND